MEFEAVQACVSQERDPIGGADDKVDPSVTVDIRGGDERGACPLSRA
jgi:hypothetical protein